MFEKENLQNKNNLGRNFLFSFLITVIIGLVNTAYPILLGLLYTAEIMGRFSILFYYSMLLAIPIANGIAPALTRYIATDSIDEKKLEKISHKLSSIYLVIIIITFPFFSIYLFKQTIFDLLIILVLLGFTVYHYIFRKTYQGNENFKLLLKIEIISFTFFIPTMLVFTIFPQIFNWFSPNGFYLLFLPVIIYRLVFIIQVIFRKLYLFKDFKIKNTFKFPSITKNVLLYALFIGMGSLFSLGISQIQVIISEQYVSKFELGVLSFWNSAMAPIILLSITLGAILVPRITKLINIDDELVYVFLKKISRGFILILMPLIGILYVLIGSYPEILDIITLSKYDMTIYWLIPLLLSFQVVCKLQTSFTIAYYSATEKNIVINAIAAFIFSIIVSISWIILVPYIGVFGFPAGLAIGGFVDSILIQIIAYIITKRKVGKQIIFLVLFDVIIISGICIVIFWSKLAGIIALSIIAIPSLIFGVRDLIFVFRNKNFSHTSFKIQAEENKLIEES